MKRNMHDLLLQDTNENFYLTLVCFLLNLTIQKATTPQNLYLVTNLSFVIAICIMHITWFWTPLFNSLVNDQIALNFFIFIKEWLYSLSIMKELKRVVMGGPANFFSSFDLHGWTHQSGFLFTSISCVIHMLISHSIYFLIEQSSNCLIYIIFF